MDHLPDVKHPYNPIQIPCLSSEDYDGCGFDDYDVRQGWTSTRLENTRVDANLRRKAIEFLQTWLYFGTLSEVVGFPVPKSDFTRRDGSRDWVTTRNFPTLFQRWEKDVASSSSSDQGKRCRKSVEIMNFVARKITDSDKTGVYPVPTILDPEHEFSVALLLFTLDAEMCKVYTMFEEAESSYLLRPDSSHMQLLKSRFPGSCPCLVSRLVRHLQLDGMYYASLLSPPSNNADHKKCTEYGCTVEISTDSMVHSQPGCQCEHVHLDLREFYGHDFSMVIPLLSIENDESGIRLKVVPFVDEVKTAYIAISHVWADGLGSRLHANVLPECQLRVLHQRVLSAYPRGQGLFWIDTLCVPCQPQEARRSAISKMNDVYQQAEMVFVLDAELVHSTKECSVEEIMMRITRSRWLTRLWTFQEAVLARRLVFQFLEGAVDIHGFQDVVTHKITSGTIDTGVLIQSMSFWVSFRQLGRHDVTRWQKLALVCRQVGWRSTSCADDEAICLANIMGLNTTQILEAQGSERMRLFWSLQKENPSAILFEPGKRLRDEGFRWAHSSLLNTPLDEDYTLSVCKDMASVERQGLIIHGPGFLLCLSGKITNNIVCLKDQSESKWYFMTRSDEMISDDWLEVISQCSGRSSTYRRYPRFLQRPGI